MSPGVFVLLIQLPPSSTLFPYTTLFRSVEVAVSAAGIFLVADDDAGRPTVGGFLGAVEDLLGHHVTVDGQGQDRKSTRLNSSHVSSSYAVFCLKKKKHNDGTKCGNRRSK